jgi:hypothetical protein
MAKHFAEIRSDPEFSAAILERKLVFLVWLVSSSFFALPAGYARLEAPVGE